PRFYSFTDPAPTALYPLSLHDALPISLVEERGGTLTVVNCGHPAPLLLRHGRVIPLDPPQTAPPLGLSPKVQPRVEHLEPGDRLDRKSTRLNSSHVKISYAVFCLKKKK